MNTWTKNKLGQCLRVRIRRCSRSPEYLARIPRQNTSPEYVVEHYEVVETSSEYAGVLSTLGSVLKQAESENGTEDITRRMQKKSQKEWKGLEKLSKKPFRCDVDAMEAFRQWQKKSEFCQAEPQVISKPCYKSKGRPADGVAPDHYEYYVTGCCSVAVQARGNAEASLGCFILATNDTDTVQLNTAELLKTYKSQQQVG